jgi:hypothetical protein
MIFALATMAVCGCSSGDDFTLPQGGDTSLTIELEQSRTYLGESVNGYRAVYWSSGDQIMANEQISSEAKIVGENAKSATFDFESEIVYPCNVLYPASFYKNATTITLPSVQQQTLEGNIDANTLPMATCIGVAGEMPRLHHLTGVIHLQLKAENDTHNNNIRLIEFWGGSEVPKPAVAHEQVSGDFAIDYATATLTPTSNDVSTQKVSVVLTQELSADKVTDIFIVVPAQEYKNGFTVRVINEVGHYMDKTKHSAQTIAKGEILKMPEFMYIPTGTLIGVEIPNDQ